MSFWDVFGVIFVLFSAAILVPRVHIKAEFSKNRREVRLLWRWLSLRMDFSENLFSGKVLFRKFPREKKPDLTTDEAQNFTHKPSKRQEYESPTQKPEPDVEMEPIELDLPSEIPISEPTIDSDEQIDEPASEPYQTDYSRDDTFYEAPKKKRFKIPRVKFDRKAKMAEPEDKKTGEDKWFWLKFAWHERGLGIDLLKGVFRSMGRFIHRIRTDFCNIDLSLGTGDPMTTALAVGGLESTLWILRKHGRVEIAPLYDEQRFDFAVSCSFSMRPYQAVSVLVWYLVTLPWVRMVRVGWDVKGRVFGK